MNKMFKRIIALVMCLSIIAPVCVFAYAPGPREYKFKFDNIISANNATRDSKGMLIGAGGSVSTDLLLPFTAAKAHFEYSAEKDVNLTISTGRNTYQALLSSKEKKATVELMNEEVAELVLTISADSQVLIKSLVFEKVDLDYSPSNVNSKFTFTANEEALLTTVGIREGSVALYDRGAMRYLDFNNTRTAAKSFDGVLYVPAFALSRALDMYIEDYQDLEYVFLRSLDDKIEIYYNKGEAYYTTAGIRKAINLPVKYADGLTWLPVSQVAELAEKTVLTKDGITVIDFRLNAENVIENSGVFDELREKLEKYQIQDNSGAKVYHVAKAKYANDNNPGTEAFPFETIGKAAEIAEAGDTVIIHGGTYSELVTPKNDGEPSKPIKFMAAEGEEVIMSNIAELSGFAKFKDNIWCVAVPEKMGKYRLQVFYNGEALTQGRYPNTHNQDKAIPYYEGTNENMFAVHGDIVVGNRYKNPDEAIAHIGQFYLKSDKGLLNQAEKDYWKGATWLGLKGAGWYLSSAPVTGSEYGKLYVEDGGFVTNSIVYYYQNHIEDYGYLSNHINTVDAPGEWYYDGTTLYIIPPEGVDGKDLTVSVKQGFTSFDLTDKKFIEIHNINTMGASITMAGESEHNILNGGRHEHVSFSTFSTNKGRAGYNDFSEVEDDKLEMGAGGIHVEGDNNAIVNTIINNSAISGINVAGRAKYAFIYNNEVSNIGYLRGDSGVQITGGMQNMQTGGHQFVYNTIRNTGARGFDSTNSSTEFDVGPMLPMEVAYNHIYNTTLYARDAGCLYMHYGNYGHDRENTQVHHNLAHDSLKTSVEATPNIGFYFDNATTGIDGHNNLVYWTDPDSSIVDSFAQRKAAFPESYSTVPLYSNKCLNYIEEHVDMQQYAELPNGKPFAVGALLATNGRFYKDGKFMGNYNSYKDNYGSLLVQDAVLSDGAYMTEDGYAVLGKTGKVTFKNVDLTGKNNFVAYVAGNEKARDYVLNLKVINDRGEVVVNDPASLMITSDAYDGSTELEMRSIDFEGKFDIVISSNSPQDKADELRLIRLRAEHTDKEAVLPSGATVVYGGNFTGSVHHSTRYRDILSNYRLESRYDQRIHNYVNYTFENTAIYHGITATKDYEDLVVMVQADTGTEQEYYMQIRVGSEFAPPIAEFDLNFVPELQGGREVTGYVWRKMKVKLPEKLKAGTYDFYVTFEDRNNEDPTGSDADTADLAYFAFYNESEQSAK